MNDRSLSTIIALLDRYPEPPYTKDTLDSEKEQITFSKWALNEMLDLVMDHPWTLASETIWDFQLKCQLYVRASVTDEQRRIFSIAAHTAAELLEKIKEVED